MARNLQSVQLRGQQDEPITAFKGRWHRLSNFSTCCITFKGYTYTSVEHAYQAQKSHNLTTRRNIRDCETPAMAKRLGRDVVLRSDWENIKISIMKALLREKFSQEPARSLLLSTGNARLIEGNWWGDRFWGQCPVDNGKNWLGRLLMKLRAELR